MIYEMRLSKYPHFLITDIFLNFYIKDDNEFIYILLCAPSYPQRCAYACLDECQKSVSGHLFIFVRFQLKAPARNGLLPSFTDDFNCQFPAKCGSVPADKKDGYLNSKCRKLLEDACKKYEDPSKIDKLSAVNQKVEKAKDVMHLNIANMLEQGIKVDKIQLDAGKTFFLCH